MLQVEFEIRMFDIQKLGTFPKLKKANYFFINLAKRYTKGTAVHIQVEGSWRRSIYR